MGLVVGVAATAALGVGVAAAIAERDRRTERARRTRDRQLSLLPGEPPAQGLRRMVLGQLDLAIEMLAADNSATPTAEAVHETRKALKRLRTLVKLLEDDLGAQAAASERAILRDAGRRLAGARDAEVMVSTLEALLQRHPRKLARRAGVRRLRGRLLAEREHATARLLADRVVRAQVVSDLRAVRARMAAWTPAGGSGIRSLEPALKRLYGQGRRRYVRASQGRGDRVTAMHRWRKSVKDLRYAAEALSRTHPAADKGAAAAAAKVIARAGRRASQRSAPGLLPMIARRADRLGERLGEEHDLVLLAERVRAEGHGCGRGTRRALLKRIDRRRKRLRRRALQDGARLYGGAPKKLVRRVRRAYAREARL
jgi:CHAD domain-containing protein